MMNIEPSDQAGRFVVRVTGALTIAEVGDARSVMIDHLRTHTAPHTWEFDLGDVAEIDSAGVQLLLAVANSTTEHQIHASVVRTSPVIDTVAKALGLANGVHCCGLARASSRETCA